MMNKIKRFTTVIVSVLTMTMLFNVSVSAKEIKTMEDMLIQKQRKQMFFTELVTMDMVDIMQENNVYSWIGDNLSTGYTSEVKGAVEGSSYYIKDK